MIGPVVVTGASGFIGRRLVALLRAQGRQVEGWTRTDVDLTDPAAVATAIDRAQPQTLFHLASAAVIPARQVESCVAVEVAMAAAIVAALPRGVVLIQAGSMAEYGGAGRLNEDATAQPTSVYGRAKLACTQLALEHGPPKGLAVTVARIFGAYGPGEQMGRLIPNLVEKLRRGEPIALSDGAQRRDFVHVDDVCRALIGLAASPADLPGRIVNIGTGQAVTIRLACERVADAMGADRSLLRYGTVPRRATDADLLEANVATLISVLGEAPRQHFLESDDTALRALIGA